MKRNFDRNAAACVRAAFENRKFPRELTMESSLALSSSRRRDNLACTTRDTFDTVIATRFAVTTDWKRGYNAFFLFLPRSWSISNWRGLARRGLRARVTAVKVLCVTMLMLRASGFLRFFFYFVCDCRMRESVLFVSRRCGLVLVGSRVGRCFIFFFFLTCSSEE